MENDSFPTGLAIFVVIMCIVLAPIESLIIISIAISAVLIFGIAGLINRHKPK